ncbi:succinate dehydrogenase, cytochrome b556 subunit [Acidimicrobium ferrooxidans DSM 10331]|uniref:Succinate dehydrogenase, cytochrome b556 subunit n=1 Tax=Acidimicrobium ferrooxidans (strain DSM 10331 / JCM 15462 / NBRC 103882 / ICP) TaxID=525909 RepID=C7M259_ACIFD|nr:succinate dehydrogenase, cytochrome b556 subunit [Acidimicrobium ferrooxidans]ACU53157.1 succinate dehydrogenase, cytochrome b556 subunit [Acidimicrobium ferrooxidans DSM 10331]
MTSPATPAPAGGRAVRARASMYRGKTGQWAFILHRVTGFLVFMFILLHIVDVATLNDPHVYEQIHQLYGNIFLRLFEVGLLFALLYHALNGLRVIMIDFFPGAVRNERALFQAMLGLSVLLTIVGGYYIVKPFFVGVH